MLLSAPAGGYELTIGGFAQPEVSAGNGSANVMLQHARPYLIGEQRFGDLRVFLRLEPDLTPQVSLFEGYVGLEQQFENGGSWDLLLGQTRVPFGRQSMVWEAESQLIDKAWLTSLEPSPRVGLVATIHAPSLQMTAGAFSGAVGSAQDVTSDGLVVGRFAVRPYGWDEPITESALEGQTQLSFGVNGLEHWLNGSNYSSSSTTLLGVDVYAAFHGASLYAEYLFGETSTSSGFFSRNANFHSHGIDLQVGWALPPLGSPSRRFEIVGRYEETLANDTAPLAMPGDANQDQQRYTFGLNYFHYGQRLKAQIALTHIRWVPDVARNTSGIHGDTLYFMLTFRSEVTIQQLAPSGPARVPIFED